jgi:hypothetical protein
MVSMLALSDVMVSMLALFEDSGRS